MATGKRYFWMKLKESFMNSDTVDFFMGQPNGANYVVLYQMLCLKTINTDGRLSRQIGEVIIPYDVAKIQRDCKYFSADTIRIALELYKKFGLIYEDVDGVLVMADHENLVGSETDYAAQKQAQRNRLSTVDTSVDNVHASVHTEKDIRDEILDKEIRGLELNNKTTTTTITEYNSPARETTEPPSLSEVYDYFLGNMDVFGHKPSHEANKFYSYNANRGWDCLPDWKSAADLWIARVPDKEGK